MKVFKFVIAMVLMVWVALAVVPLLAWAQGPSESQIKAWLTSPTVLYIFMLVGSLVSMLKQWSVAKMDGASTTLVDYLKHWQEVVVTFFGNTVAFVGLIETDSLNFVSALSIGYVISSASDLLPSGSRSTSLIKPPGDKP